MRVRSQHQRPYKASLRFTAVELWAHLAAEGEPSNPKKGLFSFRGQSLRMPERGPDGRVRILSVCVCACTCLRGDEKEE